MKAIRFKDIDFELALKFISICSESDIFSTVIIEKNIFSTILDILKSKTYNETILIKIYSLIEVLTRSSSRKLMFRNSGGIKTTVELLQSKPSIPFLSTILYYLLKQISTRE
jgi:ABC-type taurine transport system substrate-binding protein